MGKFDGKVLLELGTNNGSTDIVRYARSEGAYVIVTDYLPVERSEAKQLADETAEISTTDIDGLVEFAKKKNVSGVFCGVHETNIRSALAVTERLGLPSCFTREQWDLFQDKEKFKNLCQESGIPIAERYDVSSIPTKEELAGIDYPVIVKAVDLSASQGIYICRNEKELLEGLKHAQAQSLSHHVIVEKFITGDEISATYTLVDGECRLSMMSQMYYNCEQKGLLPLPDAYIYPSPHLDRFREQVNDRMIGMIKKAGLKNGTLFITGMATDKDFAFFEAGLRIAGTLPFLFVDRVNGISSMKLMIEYALTGRIEDPGILEREDPSLKGKKCFLFSLMNRGGKIAQVTGLDKAEALPGVIRVREQRHIGDVISSDGTLEQVHLRFYIIQDTMEQIRDTVREIRRLVRVTDENGEDMLLRSSVMDIL